LTFQRGALEVSLAVFSAGLVLFLTTVLPLSGLRRLETESLDLRFRLRGVRPPGSEAVLITVDDQSLAKLGRWPLSRRVFAKAIRALDQAGTKVIVVDLLFEEPDQPISPEIGALAQAAAAALPAGQNLKLRAALQHLVEDDPDGDLEVAIRASGKVVLPVAFSFDGPAESSSPPGLSEAAFQRFEPGPTPTQFPLQPVSALLPLKRLATAAAGLGHVNIAYDVDGSPRYDYLALPFNGDLIPSIAVRTVSAFLGVQWSDVSLIPDRGVRIGNKLVPTDPEMRLLINYRGPPQTFPSYSFVDLVEGRIPAEALRGRIALIGASFVGARDSSPSPFENGNMTGTERLANIIDTILKSDFLAEEPPPWPVIIDVVVLLLSAGMALATRRLDARVAVVVSLAPVVGWVAGAQCAFLHGLWLPLVTPALALAVPLPVVLMSRFWVMEREGRAVKQAFRHYLAPELVNILAEHPEQLTLGGETRLMTIMFCDIRGFTSISERLKENPQALTRLINRFLTPMSEIIIAHGGTIDKFIGDCIMAFWNAPLADERHAHHACAAALAMVRALDVLNRQLEAEAAAEIKPFYRLSIGIGLNSGQCVVGNMGSDQRFDYSVLGHTVNVASRLESLTKKYDVGIIVGESTRALAGPWAMIELDTVAVVGNREAVRIYALLGDESRAKSPAFRALAVQHELMLTNYAQKNWPRAREALLACRRFDEGLAQLCDIYERRITRIPRGPRNEDWDDVSVDRGK
jgi:adenylate cyclase